MTFAIRPFAPSDYEAAARIATLALGHAIDAEELRYQDEHRPAKCKHSWWVAAADGQVLGACGYDQYIGRYHPHKFALTAWVHPQHQNCGIGTALYETVMTALARHEPISVAAQTRESVPAGVRFLTRRGFREAMRSWQSALELERFDPAAHADAESGLREHGIRVVSHTDLAADPDRDRKLFELANTTRLDIPSPEPHTPLDYQTWLERQKNPNFLPDGFFVAVDGDRYIGLSTLWRSVDKAELQTGVTAVRREYRNQSIARGLKVHALAWAKRQGYQRVITFNATTNAPMLAVNERLGFVREPAWIEFIKLLQAE